MPLLRLPILGLAPELIVIDFFGPLSRGECLKPLGDMSGSEGLFPDRVSSSLGDESEEVFPSEDDSFG